ncbi:MAG: multicopper oxidase domain-containing protein [Nitrospirota bacterium]
MRTIVIQQFRRMLTLMAVVLLFGVSQALGAIQGVTGTTFNLTAKADYISMPDGAYIYMWGYALNNSTMQYPGPTLIVNQGDTVTVTLNNTLSVPVSIVFPGQGTVTATGGAAGLITQEALPGSSVTYTFKAEKPGTYIYYSGTQPDLQIEMGLVGAIIVRPTGYNETTNRIAYNHANSTYDHEYLFLLSEIDPVTHQHVEQGRMDLVDTSKFWPVYWLYNGRAAPDVMLEANAPWLPTQPYNCVPMAHPGERVLARIVSAGRDMHPFHTHGNHHTVIARDGRLLQSTPVAGADLAYKAFTSSIPQGGTADAIFQWVGKTGWDIYGTGPDREHTCNGIPVTAANPASPGFDPVTQEYCPDHGKPFPVALPNQQDLTFGQFFSGSPFLGTLGQLPPGQGGFNPNGGYMFMWHSHSEKELTNNDIFPGGMLTMMIIEAPGVPLMNP